MRKTRQSHVSALPLALLLLAGFSATVQAVKPGCEYKFLSPGANGGKPFQEAALIVSDKGVLDTTITVEFADHEIAGCKTVLRNYNGKLIGPTLRARPGDTLNILLDNLLPPDAPPPGDMNIPHAFNTTNFHTHGLHVSPTGNSDNVLISILPGTRFQVEVKIPLDHPTGTFWYHAHLHGSTALQVSSGMAGALIIENPDDPKSLDGNPAIKAAKEQILMLQQVSYDENGVVDESYTEFGPGSWANSQRLPMINGQIMPVIAMQPGEVRRWRLIHGGIRETFMVAVLDTDAPGKDGQGVRQPLYEIAVDGLSLGYMNQWDELELQPGYRVDALFKAPPLATGETEKVYYLMDVGSDASQSLLAVVEAAQVLAKIVVKGESMDMALPCAGVNQPCPALQATRPHKDITDAELTGEPQLVRFNIGARLCPDAGGPCRQSCDPAVDAGCKTRFMVNDWPFTTSRTRTLELGTASEWTLSSGLANHPFHIHVNPFQVTRKNPDGQDEIVWKDTLLVKQQRQTSDPKFIKIRSRYTRYIGKFVLHCHILDHEDQGMMEVVEVSLPGAAAHGGH